MHLSVLTQTRRRTAISVTVILIGLIILPFLAGLAGASWIRILDFALLYIMLALGLNIVVGFAGLLDLGYIAFYAVGAYLTAMLASPQFATVIQSFASQYPTIGQWLISVSGPSVVEHGIHLPVWLVIPFSAALAAVFGVILGAPTLKLRGDYLAIVTLGFGEIIRIFMNNLDQPVNFTNGPQGIDDIDPMRFGPLALNASVDVFGLTIPSIQLYYYLFLVLVVVIVVFCARLQNSRIGRAWVAIREDEVAAKAMGINTRNIKLLAFAMGATFGGVSGTMFATLQRFISPESFILDESIGILAMVVIGGMGHIPGVILGAIILSALPEVLRHAVPAIHGPVVDAVSAVTQGLPAAIHGSIVHAFDNVLQPEVLRSLIFGLAMVIIMLKRPSGLWPAPEHGRGLGGIPAKRSAAEGA